MNPLRLTLTGFRGITSGLGRAEVTIDLTMPGDLVAIVGPNGAGKTTILDNLHPYRLMPSRASSYSPAAFSYYEHTSGLAKKVLLWEHDGATYESTILIKGATKTRAQECYLNVVTPTGAVAYALPDGTAVSDGKAATYDRLVEHILGSPELFFTAAFSCQGRRTLADYTNGDIKGLLSELLGLDAITALGADAKEVAQIRRAKLDGLREQVAQADAVRTELDAMPAEEDAAGERLAAAEAAKAIAREALTAAQQRLAEVQASAATEADVARRRETLTAQIKAVDERERAAVEGATASGMAALKEAEAAVTAADTAQDRATRQRNEVRRRLADHHALLERRAEIEGAAAALPDLEAEVAAARATQEQVFAQDTRRQSLQKRLEGYQNDLRFLTQAGHALKATCEDLHRRAALTSEVPCKGTAMQDACRLLAHAVAARDEAIGKEAELETKRAEREALVRLRDAAQAELDSVPPVDVAGAAQEVRLIERRAREAAVLAAEAPALAATAARLEQDEAAIAELEDAIVAHIDDATAARERAATARTALDLALAGLRQGYAAERAALQAELDALPVTDAEQRMATATAAVAEADRALTQADANVAAATTAQATLAERRAGLQRRADALADTVALATALEDDLAQWTLLAQALGPNGIVALCIDDAGPTLTRLANDLLTACYGPRFSVAIHTQEETKAGTLRETFDIIVYDAERGDAKSIRDVSGGERIWINEAMTRAIALYQAQASGRHYEALFSDESDGALDAEKKRQFARMKRAVLEAGGYTRELYISHSAEVQEFADATINLADLKAA